MLLILICIASFLSGCVEDGIAASTADGPALDIEIDLNVDEVDSLLSALDSSLYAGIIDSTIVFDTLTYLLQYDNSQQIIDSIIVGFAVPPIVEPYIELLGSEQAAGQYTIAFIVPLHVPLVIGYTALYQEKLISESLDTLVVQGDTSIVKLF
jgi:hypothetical protein